MTPWTKDDPHWAHGTRDVLMADHEDQVVRGVMAAMWRRHQSPFVLDAGAGSGHHSRIMFPVDGLVTRTDLLPDEQEGILHWDLTKDMPDDVRRCRPSGGGWHVVHARRVLSNLSADDLMPALDRLWECVRIGGSLLIVDVFEPHRSNVQRLRTALGQPELPPRHRGQLYLRAADLAAHLARAPAHNHPIAADYYLWTRVLAPVLTNRETPFEAADLRRFVPAVTRDTADYFGVHRLLEFVK